MAELVKSVVAFSDVGKEVAYTAASGTDYIVDDNADQRVIITMKNADTTHDATVLLKAGDGILSAKGDVSVTVPATKTIAVPLTRVDSARVKITNGADKGKIDVTESIASGGTLSNLTIGVISIA